MEPNLIGATGGSSENRYALLLEWHGLTPNRSGNEFLCDCPFVDCPSYIDGKPEKFTMQCQTAQWRCFVCNRQGNAYTFLDEIHANSLSKTTEAHLQQLCSLRKGAIEVPDLIEMQVARNPATEQWCVPAWNAEGKISNLYIWKDQYDPESGKLRRQFMSSPTFNHVPYGIHRLRPASNRPIFVTEGQWDYIALMGIFRRLELSNKYDILAAPGAGTFPKKYLSVFNGREVILLYDNDKAGTTGMESLVNNMVNAAVMPLSVKRIVWPSDLKEGFDISDVKTSLPQKYWKKA